MLIKTKNEQSIVAIVLRLILLVSSAILDVHIFFFMILLQCNQEIGPHYRTFERKACHTKDMQISKSIALNIKLEQYTI